MCGRWSSAGSDGGSARAAAAGSALWAVASTAMRRRVKRSSRITLERKPESFRTVKHSAARRRRRPSVVPGYAGSAPPGISPPRITVFPSIGADDRRGTRWFDRIDPADRAWAKMPDAAWPHSSERGRAWRPDDAEPPGRATRRGRVSFAVSESLGTTARTWSTWRTRTGSGATGGSAGRRSAGSTSTLRWSSARTAPSRACRTPSAHLVHGS